MLSHNRCKYDVRDDYKESIKKYPCTMYTNQQTGNE